MKIKYLLLLLTITSFSIAYGQDNENPNPKDFINVKVLIKLLENSNPGNIDTAVKNRGFKYYKQDSAIIRGTQNYRYVTAYANKSHQRLTISIENGVIHAVIYEPINFDDFLSETKSLGYAYKSTEYDNGYSDEIYSNDTYAVIFRKTSRNGKPSCSILVSRIP